MKPNNKNKNWVAKLKEAERQKEMPERAKEEAYEVRKRLSFKLERKVIESIHAIASSTPPKPKPKPTIENTKNVGDADIK